MLNAQIQRLHEVATAMAKTDGGKFAGEENATIFNAILDELRGKLPNDVVLKAVPSANKETRWSAFVGMTSQLQAVADHIQFA